MQTELAGMGVEILGINRIGSEGGNTLVCTDRDIPWLQDDTATRSWDLWSVVYRDVRILGADNELLAVYNLTSNDLGIPANYDALKTMLIDAAGPP